MMRVFFLMTLLLIPVVVQAQSQTQASQQSQAPCTRGSSQIMVGGVDLDVVRCQVAMMTTNIGNLETSLAAIQAQLTLRDVDLKEARKSIDEMNGKISWWEKCAADPACVAWVSTKKTGESRDSAPALRR